MKILRQKQYWLDHCFDEKYESIRKKIRESFKGLIFKEDTHQYFYNGMELTCVSNVTHQFQEHFDAETKAVEVYERHFDNPESKYYHMTVEQIKQAWIDNSKEACETGTARHLWGENAMKFMMGKVEDIDESLKDRVITDEEGLGFVAEYPKEEAICSFFTDMPICFIPILPECQMFNLKIKAAGTADILFYYDAELDEKTADKSCLTIWDYKTNKDLYKNFKGKTLLPPFEEELDRPLGMYKLQISTYQLFLEDIGFKIGGRRLVWLLPDGQYERIPLESYTNKLRKVL